MKVDKYGQAEYAYEIMKKFSEKLFDKGIITEQQFRQLDDLNKSECISQFCTASAA